MPTDGSESAGISEYDTLMRAEDGHARTAGARRGVVVVGSATIVADIGLAALANALNQADRQIMPIAAVAMRAELGWTQMQLGYVLSAFAYGYICVQLPSGWISARLPPFALLFAAVTAWSACTALTAGAARASFPALIACRVAMGVAEGFCLPAIFQLFTTRVPVRLRSRAFAAMLGSGALGQLAGLLVAPLVPPPWERTFFLFGGAGVAWCALCLLVACAHCVCCCLCRPELRVTANLDDVPPPDRLAKASAPRDARARARGADEGEAHSEARSDSSSTLSADERASEPSQVAAHEPAQRPPLAQLLVCRPLLAICCAHFGQNWSNYMLSSWLPTYLSEVLGMPTRGLAFTSLPFLANALAGMAVGSVADALIARRACSVLAVRRLATAVGLLGPAVCHVIFPAAKTPATAIAIVSASFTLGAATSSGFMANHADISQSYAGLTFGVANTFATIPGLLAGPLTARMVRQAGGAWEPVFWTAAGVNVVCTCVYVLLSRAHRVL